MRLLLLLAVLALSQDGFDVQQSALLRTYHDANALKQLALKGTDEMYKSVKLGSIERLAIRKFADAAQEISDTALVLLNSENYEGDKAAAIAILAGGLQLSQVAITALDKEPAVRDLMLAAQGAAENLRLDAPGIRRDGAEGQYTWR